MAVARSDIEAAARTGAAVGVIVSTPAVARWIGLAGDSVITSYGDAVRARAAARQLAAGGVRGLLSFGPAVGLAPLLRPGDLVIAEGIVLPSGATIPTDPVWRMELARRLGALRPGLTVARLAGRDQLAYSAHEKRSLFRATFAAALDSESHAIAEVARSVGLQFLAVRAIADPAEQSRPAAASRMPHRHAYAAPLGGCLGRPWQLPAVWRSARNGRTALLSLRQLAQGIGSLASGG